MHARWSQSCSTRVEAFAWVSGTRLVGSPNAVSPWLNDVSLVLAGRDDGVGVFRVLDHTYPAP